MEKTLLITGCSSGIGYDAARGMRDRGWRVFASCRKEEDCARLRDEGFESPRIDYTDEASIRSGLAEVLKATGGTLDALFNNGAYGLPAASEDLPRDALRAIFETNVFGWHDLTRQVIPVMRRQGHGRIVHNSSILGLIPYEWRGAYSATKYAIEGLADVSRLELRSANIDVVLIEPGPVTSEIRRNSVPHFEKWIDWQRSARAADYLVLRSRLYSENPAKDSFELPPSAVTKVLARALEARRPRARYTVTLPAFVASVGRRFLPARWVDGIILYVNRPRPARPRRAA
ncbi:SDR family NAD(P)-dependent oxidoreductase [Pseudoroseicyclus tamaricis]|uniref:SDR family NAD(P)-dependent oxidoreductase n=1 Tax=Pseudoroseicyclus tamaricis TaxID=2705421 RepID=A0A6B2JWS9_9RHOB|nr:SDR family NAD(P)-dependent oxidoreductase [Pseudoroseicyclus tamaricis]NDV02365.1 SDR family NAD(P)-dependent oxidoreductase [Pseudoroseicyclus tamaricis]